MNCSVEAARSSYADAEDDENDDDDGDDDDDDDEERLLSFSPVLFFLSCRLLNVDALTALP